MVSASASHGDVAGGGRIRTIRGEKPQFQTVSLKFISNAAARSAALLSGAVDVIEQIPPSEYSVFQNRQNVAYIRRVDTDDLYRNGSGRDDSPFITDADGCR